MELQLSKRRESPPGRIDDVKWGAYSDRLCVHCRERLRDDDPNVTGRVTLRPYPGERVRGVPFRDGQSDSFDVYVHEKCYRPFRKGRVVDGFARLFGA